MNKAERLAVVFCHLSAAICFMLWGCCEAQCEEWRFRLTGPVLFRIDESLPPEATAEKQPDWYLVCFSASWCGPCRAWQRQHLAATRQILPVVMVDIDKAPEWKRSRAILAPGGGRATIPGITSVPTFWLVHRRSRYPVIRWSGGKSAEQIRRLIPPAVPGWTKDTEAAPELVQ